MLKKWEILHTKSPKMLSPPHLKGPPPGCHYPRIRSLPKGCTNSHTLLHTRTHISPCQHSPHLQTYEHMCTSNTHANTLRHTPHSHPTPHSPHWLTFMRPRGSGAPSVPAQKSSWLPSRAAPRSCHSCIQRMLQLQSNKFCSSLLWVKIEHRTLSLAQWR